MKQIWTDFSFGAFTFSTLRLRDIFSQQIAKVFREKGTWIFSATKHVISTTAASWFIYLFIYLSLRSWFEDARAFFSVLDFYFKFSIWSEHEQSIESVNLRNVEESSRASRERRRVEGRGGRVWGSGSQGPNQVVARKPIQSHQERVRPRRRLLFDSETVQSPEPHQWRQRPFPRRHSSWQLVRLSFNLINSLYFYLFI